MKTTTWREHEDRIQVNFYEENNLVASILAYESWPGSNEIIISFDDYLVKRNSSDFACNEMRAKAVLLDLMGNLLPENTRRGVAKDIIRYLFHKTESQN